jgi:hypothetical protein
MTQRKYYSLQTETPRTIPCSNNASSVVCAQMNWCQSYLFVCALRADDTQCAHDTRRRVRGWGWSILMPNRHRNASHRRAHHCNTCMFVCHLNVNWIAASTACLCSRPDHPPPSQVFQEVARPELVLLRCLCALDPGGSQIVLLLLYEPHSVVPLNSGQAVELHRLFSRRRRRHHPCPTPRAKPLHQACAQQAQRQQQEQRRRTRARQTTLNITWYRPRKRHPRRRATFFDAVPIFFTAYHPISINLTGRLHAL